MNNFEKYTLDNAPAGSKDTLQGAQKAFGFTPNLLAHMAGSPALLKSYMAVFGFLSESTLSPLEQQVVLMTVNRFHECRYCMGGHSKVSEMTGLDMKVITAIRDDLPIGDAKLAALQGFTRKMVEQRGIVSQTQLKAVFAVGYTNENVLEIVSAIALKVMSNFTNHLVGTELDSAFEDMAWTPANER